MSFSFNHFSLKEQFGDTNEYMYGVCAHSVGSYCVVTSLWCIFFPFDFFVCYFSCPLFSDKCVSRLSSFWPRARRPLAPPCFVPLAVLVVWTSARCPPWWSQVSPESCTSREPFLVGAIRVIRAGATPTPEVTSVDDVEPSSLRLCRFCADFFLTLVLKSFKLRVGFTMIFAFSFTVRVFIPFFRVLELFVYTETNIANYSVVQDPRTWRSCLNSSSDILTTAYTEHNIIRW